MTAFTFSTARTIICTAGTSVELPSIILGKDFTPGIYAQAVDN